MTNHKQVAIDWVDYSSNLNPDVDNKASHAAQLAQVHATLALAEQQRATNLILATALTFGWGKSDITAPWTSVNDTPRWEGYEVTDNRGVYFWLERRAKELKGKS